MRPDPPPMTPVTWLAAPPERQSAIGPRSLQLGRQIFEQGRVLWAEYNAARGLATGMVRSSAHKTYQCIVNFGRAADESPGPNGQCSCPRGCNCEHVVAILLALEDMGTLRTGDFLQPDLPLELREWLLRAEQLAAQGTREETSELLYRVRRDAGTDRQRIVVSAEKARRRADGEYGRASAFDILGTSQAPFLNPQDQRILALARAHQRYPDGRSAVALDQALGSDLLRAIVESGRGYWGDRNGPKLRWGGPITGRLEWQLCDNATTCVVLTSDRPGTELLPLTPPWYLDPKSGACGPVDTGMGDQEAALLAQAPPLALEHVAILHDRARLGRPGLDLPFPPRIERRLVKSSKPIPYLRLESEVSATVSDGIHWHSESIAVWRDMAVLRFDYAGITIAPNDQKPTVSRVENGVLLESERDFAAEGAAIRQLHDLDLEVAPQQSVDAALAFVQQRELSNWLWFIGTAVPRLEAQGWRVEVDESFRFRVAHAGQWRLAVTEPDGTSWLELGLGVDVDGETIDLLPLLVHVLEHQDESLTSQALADPDPEASIPVRLDDGRFLLMPVQRLRPIVATLVELYDPRTLSHDGRLQLPRAQLATLAELEEADPDLAWNGGDAARRRARQIKNFTGIQEVAPPVGLTAQLRPYQRQGLNWLQFLRELELGGILADDMGLGKTVQTLAHLLAEKELGRADLPSLVVAPTSLMFNWRREVERFAPSLRVLVLHGPERREHFAAVPEHDLVLTTYPLLTRDRAQLINFSFHLLVLDEAQAIKNPRSKVANAAGMLKARHRLCLTGTPFENHLGELWSLLNFLNPGVLGDERRFKRLFRTPIERDRNEVRQAQLRTRVAPFLLRRTKEAVATELPPKTEILRQVPLLGDQRDVYETLRLALHEKVRREVERKGFARSGIVILDALLKLRQVCCDPRLVPLDSVRKAKNSAKLELLMSLLPELLAEGRRVLLFSQFTSMLDLIKLELKRLGMREQVDYVTLTGQTRNRSQPVDRFQAGEVPLFLISLKAGGSGLNLTAADVVIHYDPWWNPATEHQATDRAHRIGQDKPVFVYKLLTEGTVEQKVVELQARKQSLADGMLASGGTASGALSAGDLETLFAPVT